MFYDFKRDIDYLKIVMNMNESTLAEFLQVSRMTLNRWKNNKALPNYDTLEKIYNKIYNHNINLNRIKEESYSSSISANHQLLFHGSKTKIIGNPSISYSENKKDFGKGFYLGESFEQSANFVSSFEESSIYIFDFNKENAKIKEYSVSKEWMILIAYFRGRLDEFKDSKYVKNLLNELNDIDVVIAPIADNTMYTTLDDFINGKITDLQCLNALSANRLGKQFVFLNDKIIDTNLKMLERCFYCESERNDYYSYRLKENQIGKDKVKIALRQFAGKGAYIEDLL